MTVDPAVATRGQKVTITVGSDAAGDDVAVWLYSDPQRIATGSLSASGAISVTIPTDAALGAHRIAVYAADGALLGWADIRIAAEAGGLATTGSELPVAAIALALMLLVAGGVAFGRRRRTV